MQQERSSGLANIISKEVDERREEIVQFCCELIKIPSVSGQEKEIQQFVAEHLKKMGLEVRMWDPDLTEMKKHPGYVETGKDYRGRPNVIGVLKGKGGGKSIILNGHTDVVIPEPLDEWSYDPWGGEISNGKIYGRGACDMKGGIAGMIKALEILLDLGLYPTGDVTLEVVVDEEESGNGTLASILKGYNADAAIFCEPSWCKIMLAHRGASFWRIYVEGKGAHAGVMHEGISAVDKALIIYQAIQDLGKIRNKKVKNHPLYSNYPIPAPLCIGKIKSGEWPSAVPEKCVLEGTIEFVPGEKLDKVRAELEDVVRMAAQKDLWLRTHLPKLEWFGLHFPAVETSSQHSLVKTFEEAYFEIKGEKAQISGFPGGCDMRLRILYSRTPSIIFGPGDISRAHRVDEFIEIEELILFTKILALGLLKWSKK